MSRGELAKASRRVNLARAALIEAATELVCYRGPDFRAPEDSCARLLYGALYAAQDELQEALCARAELPLSRRRRARR